MDTESDSVKIVPASCTKCGGTVDVDPQTDAAVCPFCGTAFIVEKAINNYNVQHAKIEHADNVNIDLSGSVKTVLNFVGDQMDKSRAEKGEYRKQAAEHDKMMTKNFFKMFIILFAFLFVMTIVSFLVFQIIDPDDGEGTEDTEGTVFSEDAFSEDEVVSCCIDSDGILYVNITDPGESEWRYYDDASTENLDKAESDFDGYHFVIKPSHYDGTGYAVVAEYKSGNAGAFPDSYGIVKFTIGSWEVNEVSEVVHVSDLSMYDFEG